MGLLDIIFILIFTVAVIYGYHNGLFSQLGAVGGILLGIIGCRLFGNALAEAMLPANATPNDIYVCNVFSNVLIFAVLYIIARVIFRFVKGVTHALKLTLIDRIGGVVFAIFEWFFIVSLLLNIWQVVQPQVDISTYSKLNHGRVLSAVRDFAPSVLGSETARNLFDTLP